MEYLYNVLESLYNSFLFDKIWWKDFGIPLLGAVAIPLLIWGLTWYYGADNAESRREKRELRENLNFLVSVSLGSINGLIFLEKRLQDQLEKEQEAISIIKDKNSGKSFRFDDVCFGFVYDDVFKAVSLEKYAQCIDALPNFVSDIVLIKSLLNSLDAYIVERNHILFSLANSEDMTQKGERSISFLIGDYPAVKGLVNETYRITLLLRNIIANVVKLNNDIKDLKLVPQCYNKEQLDFIKKSEEGFTKQVN